MRAHVDGLAADRQVVGSVIDADWRELASECDVVFHLAAFVHRLPRNQHDLDELREVNCAAVKRLARYCAEAGKTLVFSSTVAVFGGSRRTEIGDDAVPAPVTPYGHSKLCAEDAIAREGERGLRYSILRFPLLYGPYGRGNMERLLWAIRRNRYFPIGDPGVRKTCLFVADAARALVAAQAGLNGRYIVAPRVSPTLGDIHGALYRAVGRTPPRLAIPASLARFGAHCADVSMRIVGRRTRFAEQVSTLTGSAHFNGDRFANATGFQSMVSLDEGLEMTARWLEDAKCA